MSKPRDDRSDLPVAEFVSAAYGFALFQIAAVFARLGLPDALGDETRTAGELAVAVNADPDSLSRFLRAASAARLMTAEGVDSYALAPLGMLFRADSRWRAAAGTAWHSAPAVWQAWGSLEFAVRTGKPAFDQVHGQRMFDYLDGHPGDALLFHEAMAAGTETQLADIVEHYDFGACGHVVDVGGGNGTHLAAILGASPGLRGTVFDTPVAVAEAGSVLAGAGLADRGAAVGGDFFVSVPTGADAYLLKNVLIDWDDDSCVRILRTCREAMGEGGRVVVLSWLMPGDLSAQDPADALMTTIFDMSMLVLTPGRERTLAEYEALFTRAGLKLGAVKSIPDGGAFHAVEAVAG